MIIAMDIETYDPNLKDMGDGACRGDGKLLCVGTYNGSVGKVYIPGTPEWQELVDILKSDTPKIFHNGIYDLSWLACNQKLDINGDLHDTMTRMVYIDEYADLGLDACCAKMGVEGKNKADTIEAWWEEHKAVLGYTKKTDTMWKHVLDLWENPTGREMMIKYNLQDCKATYDLYMAQEKYIQKVKEPYMVDVELTHLIIEMKKVGVRIDKEAMANLTAQVEEDVAKTESVLINTYGITAGMVASPKQLGKRLNEMGIHSPVRTKTGAESWAVDAMNRINHPVVAAIQEYKNYSAVLNKYLHGSMATAIIGDRIHCTFSPNKREDSGTVTGRFACSHPNLQNIPARDKVYGHSYGQAMRSLFLPEEGCMMAAMDYSQIEYLLLAHFAVGPQAEWFRAQANAGVDFHTVGMQATGIPSRQVVKTFNYGVIYGMGWYTAMIKNYCLFYKLATEHGTDIETYTKKVYNEYHAKLPVIHDTMTAVQYVAKLQGYVKTIGGRMQHKPKPVFDPATGKINDFMYKMLNKLIQGSAADILKFALLKAWKAGLFNVLTMHITVHDENVVSVPYNKIGTEAAVELKRTMDESFKEQLLVPMKACAEVGPNWGYWSDDIWEEMKRGDFHREIK